jgi:hypothetical protein
MARIKSKKYIVSYEAHLEDQFITTIHHSVTFWIHAWFLFHILNIRYVLSVMPVKMLCLYKKTTPYSGGDILFIKHGYFRTENYKALYYLRKQYGQEVHP